MMCHPVSADLPPLPALASSVQLGQQVHLYGQNEKSVHALAKHLYMYVVIIILKCGR